MGQLKRIGGSISLMEMKHPQTTKLLKSRASLNRQFWGQRQIEDAIITGKSPIHVC